MKKISVSALIADKHTYFCIFPLIWSYSLLSPPYKIPLCLRISENVDKRKFIFKLCTLYQENRVNKHSAMVGETFQTCLSHSAKIHFNYWRKLLNWPGWPQYWLIKISGQNQENQDDFKQNIRIFPTGFSGSHFCEVRTDTPGWPEKLKAQFPGFSVVFSLFFSRGSQNV